MTSIYLDNNATTPLDPRVLDAMLPFLREHFGNASSKNHPYGWQASEAVEKARAQVAGLLGASPREIIFTSGATEANNLAILGLACGSAPPHSEQGPPARNHIITQATEHHAVLDPCHHLEKRGFETTRLAPDPGGRVRAEQVRNALTDRTMLASIMMANNEIGTLQPVAEIGALLRRTPVVLHTDAAQAVGKVPVDVEKLGVDLLSLSAHKLYGPKGVGALFLRRGTPKIKLRPLQFGGGQEHDLRPGTLNVAGIVGLGEACRLAREELESEAARLRGLRDRLRDGILARLAGVSVNGSPDECLPGTLSLSFSGVEGTALLTSLSGLAVSSGSACSTGANAPSYVLKALGVRDDLALSTIRFGLGRFTTESEIESAISQVIEVVEGLRKQLAVVRGRGFPT
jgi:cysteine desulfurase